MTEAAVTRFFFNYRVGEDYVRDHEGTDLIDLASARVEAVKDARHLMSKSILGGLDVSGRVFEVCDEAGRVVLEMPFAEAISRRE